MHRPKRLIGPISAAALAGLLLAGCGTSGASSSGGGSAVSAAGSPVTVGVIVSVTGNYAPQAQDFQNGFNAALDYYTNGTDVVAGHKVKILVGNDTGQPAQGIAQAKSMIAAGAKVLMGPTDSAVALAVAQQCVQNGVMFLPGTAGTYKLAGMSKLVFGLASLGGSKLLPSLLTAAGAPKGKTVDYIGQDYEYGRDYYTGLKKLFDALGMASKEYLLPMDTTNFTALAAKVKADNPTYVYSSWAGDGQNQLAAALQAQDVFASSIDIGYLLLRDTFGPTAAALGNHLSNGLFAISYFPGITGNAEDKSLIKYSAAHNHQIQYDDETGWNAGAMLVHAIKAGGTSPGAMAAALNDYSWQSPAGTVTMRGADHSQLTPGYEINLVDNSGTWSIKVVKAYTGPELATPVVTPIKS
jgi:branched-chain amino acid transport system substrate-binding protein